ncbi:uncharacterized protein LOC127898868 [Citrus sinensis]|uniref:uncharacterized protein LOC112097955 n=1 Tax=Citrus clementina TaxID=85681 RepID=UPI0007639146|nr:uncharacterized protein LOC112097955 [Citrus x clementina]XP_052287325.1 uncharacterized protein LOC127898868 [Citrus sinensis]
MADDRDRAIRDYAVLAPQVVHPGIVRPKVEAANFELKPEYIAKNESIVQSQVVSLGNLENQIGQLAIAMSSKSQGSLSSNTEDPRREGKEHCKVINLRSGKNIDILVDVTKKRLELNSSQEPPQDESMLQQPSHQDTGASGQPIATLEGNQPITAEEEAATLVVTTYNKSKEQRLECSHMLQSKIPKKLKDLESFTIQCTIGTKYNDRALCDLGANINLMTLSAFKQLGVGECRPTTVTLQLAGRSHAYPEGKIGVVLVKAD